MIRKWKIKLTLLLTILGILGIAAIIPYQMTSMMNDDFYQSGMEAMPVPVVVAVNAAFQSFLLFFLVLIGVRLQRGAGLAAPILEGIVYERRIPPISKKWILLGIVGAFIGSLATILLDLFVFSPFIDLPDGENPVTIWWQGLLAMFYGGITEELLLRLFGMTLIVWLIAKMIKKENIPNGVYYFAIFLTAILFGLGHLPATIAVFGELSAVIVLRAIVLNGLLGLWFGYLYWKKGLEYAIISHMAADFFIHVIFMSIFY
ncbi:CAAX protease self-immunity [Gracilibacillus ureilyticus]|uniref:CAAX protease self-immunity n=1 Tax=Gracilibacillus ureilyticus TaxID=531814 RepID=A0A1H9VV68_9BACI|nr:CPBP family intramembrane glutamic endopeptidase [Gracilibacillus ureilyticus]SES25656.1 CAAX protease self-immunity [Gracilibacillus ureilyticus]